MPKELEIRLKKIIQIHTVASSKDAKLGDAEYLIRKHEITPAHCLEIYDFFIQKLESSIYQHIPPSPLKKALIYRDRFQSDLNEKDKKEHIAERENQILARQCKDIALFLPFFLCNATTMSIGNNNFARIRYSKNITELKSFAVIHQSITGFYEHSINLLDL